MHGDNGLGVRPLPERFVRLLARHGYSTQLGSGAVNRPHPRRTWLEQIFAPHPAA